MPVSIFLGWFNDENIFAKALNNYRGQRLLRKKFSLVFKFFLNLDTIVKRIKSGAYNCLFVIL